MSQTTTVRHAVTDAQIDIRGEDTNFYETEGGQFYVEAKGEMLELAPSEGGVIAKPATNVIKANLTEVKPADPEEGETVESILSTSFVRMD